MNIDIVPGWTIGNISLTDSPYSVDADSTVDIGEPEMIVEGISSLVADGDPQRVVRHGNRTYVLEIYIEGPTLGDLAAAESALRSEIKRPGVTLTHDPGDGLTPESVYEVQTARLALQRNDLHESHLMRKFVLTLTCSPWARSAETDSVTVVEPPLPPAPTVVINNADTAAKWSAFVTTYTRADGFVESPVAITDAGDGIYISTFGTNVRLQLGLTATPVVLVGTPYLIVEMQGAVPTILEIDDGVSWVRPPIAMTRTTPVGTVQYVLNVGDVTVEGVRAFWSSPDPFGGRQVNALVYDVSASSAMPVVTSRQMSGVVIPGGTERTPCSLRLNPAAGEAMGTVILHTSREELTGYSPALRQYRFSGNSLTSDSTLMSGAREQLNLTPVVATVPIKSLPEDGYVLMARLRSDATGVYPLVWQARTLIGATYLGGQTGTTSANFTVANKWTLVPLALVSLPPVRASVDSWVQLNLTRESVVGSTIDLDEWWIFRAGEDSGLTMVEDTETSFLWLDSPDLSSPVPRVWVGGNGDRSDAHHPGPGLIAQGNHVLHPEGTSVFVASSGIQNPTVTATYHKRWHSNAAE